MAIKTTKNVLLALTVLLTLLLFIQACEKNQPTALNRYPYPEERCDKNSNGRCKKNCDDGYRNRG